jgi:integrase
MYEQNTFKMDRKGADMKKYRNPKSALTAIRRRIPLSYEDMQREKAWLQDIDYCNCVLRRVILSSTDIATYSEMKNKNLENLILLKHKNRISFREDKQLFCTADPSRQRHRITAKTKEALYEKLYLVYYPEKTLTLGMLFPAWIEWTAKRKGLVSGSTDRYKQLFRKYIDGTRLSKMRITEIRGSDIEEFFTGYAEKITRHNLGGTKTIINGIFDYAFSKDLIQVNIARQYNSRSVRTKAETPDLYNVFSNDDRATILNYLQSSNDMYDLAIEFMFCLCCRIGEIRALHWEDVNAEQQKIIIHREIVRRRNEEGINRDVEVPHTKTGDDSGVRILNLSPRAQGILEKACKEGGSAGYIFKGSTGNFLYQHTFSNHLKKVCKAVGIRYRSSHKIRFWAASAMAAKGADIMTLMATGGWADKQTALHYQRNVAVEQKTSEIWNETFN